MKKVISLVLSIVMFMSLAISASAIKSIPVKSIKLDKSSITLTTGKTYVLKVTLSPTNTSQKTLKFSTSNKAVATVDTKGKITAVKVGTATITVVSASNSKAIAKCNITVVKPEKLKISWASWLSGATNKDTMFEQQLEKKFPNVDFSLVMFERSTFPDQFKTRAAGGDIPDFFPSPYDNYGMITQGVAAAFDMSMIKTNMPNFFKNVAEYNARYNCEAWSMAYYSGKFYGIPNLNMQDAQPFAVGWRKDWLDNVGISKVPETIEECEAAFLKFINEDPNKNGKKDEFGICINGKNAINTSFGPFLMAYGAGTLDNRIIKNDKLVDPMVQDEMRDALRNLNKWYKLGIIDKEFITLSSEWNLYVANTIGFYDETFYQLNPGDFIYEKAKTFTPSGTVVIGNNIKGPKGYHGLPQYGPTSGNVFMFGKQLEKNPARLAEVMKVFDTMFTDKEMVRLIKFGGREGVDYTRDPVTGNPVYVSSLDTVEKRAALGSNFSNAFTGLFSIKDQLYNSYKWNINYDAELKKTGDSNVNLWTRSGITHDNTGMTVTAGMADIIWASLNPLRQQWFIDFITGTKSLDTDWDAWLDAWKKAGGKQIEDYWTSGYEMDAKVVKTVKALTK